MRKLIQILFKLFDEKELKKTYILIFLMLIGIFLEVLSIGMFLPILTFMVQDNFAIYLTNIFFFKTYLDNPDQKTIGFILLILLFFIFLIKNLYLAYLSNYQMKYVFDIQKNLSSKFFSRYINNEYSFFISSNSYQLMQNIIGEIGVFINNFLMPSLIFILEILVLIFLFILIFSIQPLSSLIIVGIFFSFSLFVYIFSKKKLTKLGQIRQENESLVIKTLQNSFLGIKDIKIFGAEKEFIKDYKTHNTKVANSVRDQLIIQSFPRLALELLTVASFVTAAFFLFYKTDSFKLILPTLGFFAASAFRIMPSVNRINNALQNIKFSKSSIKTLFEEMNNINSDNSLLKNDINDFNNIIEINNISVHYSNTSKPILNDVSLVIHKGMRIGIMGESGSGKTTFLDTILGLVKFNSGSIKFDNLEFRSNNFSLKNIIGYIPQDVFLLNTTLEENIIFGSNETEIDYVRMKKSIEISQLDKFIKDLPDGLKTRISDRGINISGGQRQRIGIARAIYKNPKILILDEATSALDIDTESRIMELVYNLDKNITVIIVTHRPSAVSKCDKVYLIKDGKIKQK
jgi:ABC-type multidrug transport system fused ATPase/permease subunit